MACSGYGNMIVKLLKKKDMHIMQTKTFAFFYT